MANRLIKGLFLAVVLGPVTGVLATVANRIVRALSTRSEPDFVSPAYDHPTGPEVLVRAEDLILAALRSGPHAGMTNAEVGRRSADGLEPGDERVSRRGHTDYPHASGRTRSGLKVRAAIQTRPAMTHQPPRRATPIEKGSSS